MKLSRERAEARKAGQLAKYYTAFILQLLVNFTLENFTHLPSIQISKEEETRVDGDVDIETLC